MIGHSQASAHAQSGAVGVQHAPGRLLPAPGAAQTEGAIAWLREHVGELGPIRWTIMVYVASRVALLVIALVTKEVRHDSFYAEIGRWDGTWYTKIASQGYPTHPSHSPTTLGFFPLYPMLIWLAVHLPGPPNSVVLCGLLISMVGGLIATVLVQRLANGWWGEATARRATVLFCFFPGSIVFSMDYAEGVLLPLAAGCILALQHRRWILAGILAGFATAIQPDALALTVACAVASLLELRRHGWRGREALRSLFAPVLSVAGIGAFAIYLWVWTGTPFANLEAQHYAWGQSVDVLALYHQGRYFVQELGRASLSHLTLNLGPLSGILGAIVLLIGIVLLFKRQPRISAGAMAFTVSVAVLSVVSETLAPNPRLLITAFPAILVFAYYCRGKGFALLMSVSGLLFIVMSVLTYGGHSLTP